MERLLVLAAVLPALALAIGGSGGSAHATEAAAEPPGFRVCVDRLAARARQTGISETTIARVLGEVRHLDEVIELDRRQPEFTRTFADYYARRVTEQRVRRGREMLREHAATLAEAQRRYGVPARYLVAFWGLETNYGGYFGDTPVPDALATLACDERRGEFFGGELLAALRIIDAGDIAPDRMVGSWAGAMGNFQFLPSVFLRHGIDADGDGRRDLWSSAEDAIFSAANFLSRLGWEAELRWGREVLLPDSFDYSLAGRDGRRPLADWVALGLTDAAGRPLPRLDLPAAVLVPAGHEGPAFLVYSNFDVIMRWNRSEYYALSIGRLADRIAGAGPLVRPPPPADVTLSRETVRRLQRTLDGLGYDPGGVDGIPGPGTRKAVAAYQRDRGRVADGHIDRELLSALEVDAD